MRERGRRRSTPFFSCKGCKVNTEVTCWIFPFLFVPVVVQEEVYREVVTDGYIIDNFYLNLFTTEASKTPKVVHASQPLTPEEIDVTEASGDTSGEVEIAVVKGKSTTATPSAWSAQPSLESKESDSIEGSGDTTNTSIFLQDGGKHHLSTTASVSPAQSTQESKENDLLEGSGDMTDVFRFLQNGSEPDVSATTSVAPGWSTQEPESKERDSAEESADTTDLSIFPKHGRRHDVSTTVSVTHTQSPSTAVLPGDTDDSGSGDSYGETIHATTSSHMSGSYTERNTASSTHRPALNAKIAPRLNGNQRSEQAGKYTKTNTIMTTSTPFLLSLFTVAFVSS